MFQAFAFPQNKTSIMLVLLTAFVLNFTCGAAHVAFHHDSHHGHRHDHGGAEEHEGHEDHPGHSSHSAQEHEPEMLLSRVRLVPEEEGAQAVVPFLVIELEEQAAPIWRLARWDDLRPLRPWERSPDSRRGPPSLS
ncbi:MAG: hypothetical protein ACPG31_13960 [Planctomycetota bacterium]